MATKVKLATRGLIGGPNEHTVDGAMRRANNVVCRRPNVIEPRPGFKVASWSSEGSSYPQQLLGVGGSADLVTHQGGGFPKYFIGPVADLGSSYESYTTGGLSDVYFPSRSMITGCDSRGNVYYNTRGTDEVADSPRGRVADGDELHPMGYPAIPPTPSLISLASTSTPVAIPIGEHVAYRATLENKLGDVLRVSVPSGRAVVSAGSASAKRVGTGTRLYLPAKTLAGDIARLWRSYGSAVLPPSDQLFLCWSKELDSTDISNGYVEWTDNTADADLGQALYTNPEREGPRSSNFRPPACNALASFQGSVLFAGTMGPHRYRLRWKEGGDCSGVATGIGYRLADGTITGLGAATITGATVTGLKIGMLLSTNTGWTGTGPPRITNIVGTTITVSHTFAGASAAVPATTYWLDSVRISCADSLGDDQYYPIAIGSNFIAAQGVLVSAVVGGFPYAVDSHSTVFAYNITDHHESSTEAAHLTTFASVMLEKYGCDGAEFEVWATHGSEYDPPLPEPTVADGEVSEADDWSDAVFYSKRNEPEHVPLGNYLRVGTLGKAVLAAKATKDGVFLFKEDGVFMFSGAGARSGFRSDPVMPSCLILTPKCASEMHGDVYAWTNLGLVSFGAGGFRVVDSGALSHELKLQQESIGTCVTDDKYSVFMATDPRTMEVFLGAWLPPTTIDGEFPEADGQNDRSAALYVYNARTSCWTTWGAGSTPCRFTEAAVCGLASPDESLEGNMGGMLFGVGYTTEVLYEMTDPAHSANYPFVDNYEAFDSVSADGVDIDYSGTPSSYSPKVGDVIVSSELESRVVVETVTESHPMRVHAAFTEDPTLSEGAYIGEGYESSVAWVAESADHAGFLKFWESIVFLFGELSRVWSWKFLTRSSHPGMGEAESEHTEATYLDDDPWQATFEAKPRRVYVHRDNAHGASLYVEWRILNGGARWTMNGGTVNYDPVSERI